VDIREIMIDFWENDYPNLHAGSGVRASTRIPSTIIHGREMFDL
jgi:hypothetical protein